jgi:hypothetical protein
MPSRRFVQAISSLGTNEGHHRLEIAYAADANAPSDRGICLKRNLLNDVLLSRPTGPKPGALALRCWYKSQPLSLFTPAQRNTPE